MEPEESPYMGGRSQMRTSSWSTLVLVRIYLLSPTWVCLGFSRNCWVMLRWHRGLIVVIIPHIVCSRALLNTLTVSSSAEMFGLVPQSTVRSHDKVLLIGFFLFSFFRHLHWTRNNVVIRIVDCPFKWCVNRWWKVHILLTGSKHRTDNTLFMGLLCG